MRLLLHAITTPPDGGTLGAAGFAGHRMLRVERGGVMVWASEFEEDAPVAFTHGHMMGHHYTIGAIFERVEACLPARFPSWTDDAEALIESHREALVRALERVKGCMELAITATWDAPDEIDEPREVLTPGRRYLRGRQRAFHASDRRYRRAEAIAEQLADVAGPAVREVMSRVCPSASVALSMALLVDRAEAQSIFDQLPRTSADVRILVNGPWPPYTFAGLSKISG